MSCRNGRRTVVIAILASALLVATAMPIYAGQRHMDALPLPGKTVDDTRAGYSPTNPQYPWGPYINTAYDLPHPDDRGPGYERSWWRNGWGNSTIPRFDLYRASSGEANAHALGMIYTVDRFPDTEINTATPEAYYQLGINPADSVRMPSLYLDILGIYAGGAPSSPPAGGRFPYEGRWYLHYRWYDSARFSIATVHIPFGIDVTPPMAVSKLVAKPYKSYTKATGAEVWFAEQRCDIQWENKQYDSLSGTALYEIRVNGKLHESRLWSLPHTYTNVTLEDDVIKPGRNKIEIIAVDRAGNRSLAQATYFNSDPDEPTLSIIAPKKDASVPAKSTFTVAAKDLGGVRNVKFYINGKLMHTDTLAPYTTQLDLSALPNGYHTFSATVTDMFGRQVTRSTTFLLDKTSPSITEVTYGPNPFYPIIREGYKDNMTVRFQLSEPASMQLLVYAPNGELWAKQTGSRPAGSVSMVWNGAGLGDAKVPEPGTYTFRLRATDKAGNVRLTPRYSVTIRDYELVRVAPNAVRIVPR